MSDPVTSPSPSRSLPHPGHGPKSSNIAEMSPPPTSPFPSKSSKQGESATAARVPKSDPAASAKRPIKRSLFKAPRTFLPDPRPRQDVTETWWCQIKVSESGLSVRQAGSGLPAAKGLPMRLRGEKWPHDCAVTPRANGVGAIHQWRHGRLGEGVRARSARTAVKYRLPFSGMTSEYPFRVGAQYSRFDIFRAIGLPEHRGGPWFTGYTSHQGDWFIFCNIGTAGRTGHDYENRFERDRLVWFGKTHSRIHQPSIRGLVDPAGRVFIFYRESDRSPFTFAGLGTAISARDAQGGMPVQIIWELRDPGATGAVVFPDEILNDYVVFEGAKKSVLVNVYERDPSARRICIDHWGLSCAVCGVNFQARYGKLGAGFIHVHHLKPLAEIGTKYQLDPVRDLRPVCPNCHAMLHRKSPALGIEDVKRAFNECD